MIETIHKAIALTYLLPNFRYIDILNFYVL